MPAVEDAKVLRGRQPQQLFGLDQRRQGFASCHVRIIAATIPAGNQVEAMR
jgi:hypothetical protein